MPEKTDAQKRAQKAYMEKFARVEIRMNAEQRTAIQAHAEAHSESVNGFINRAIAETMERDGGGMPLQPILRGVEAVQGGGVVLPSETIETAQKAAEAAGEAPAVFIARAVDTQAKRDNSSLRMGINPATGDKIAKE